jgi:hypothetical protein
MMNWTTWRIAALAATIFAIGVLGVYVATAVPPKDEGCLPWDNAPGAMTPTPIPKEVDVATGLIVLAEGDAFPRVVRTLALNEAMDNAGSDKLRSLLESSPTELRPEWGDTIAEQNAYRHALEGLLASGTPDSFFRRTSADKLVDPIRELPWIKVADGQVTAQIPLPNDTFLYSYGRSESNGDTIAAPWQVSSDGRDITWSFEGQRRTNRVARVEFCVEGMQILSASPKPDATAREGRLSWTLPTADRSTPAVTVTVRPELATALRLWVFGGEGRYAALTLSLLVPTFLLLISFFLIPKGAKTSRALQGARKRLAAATTAVFRLGIAGVLALYFAARPVSEARPVDVALLAATVAVLIGLVLLDIGLWTGTRIDLPRRLAPGVVVILALGWVLVVMAESPQTRWEAFPRVLLAAGYGTFLFIAAETWQERIARTIGSRIRTALLVNLVLGIMLCLPVWSSFLVLVPIWVTSSFVAGFLLLLAALLPVRFLTWIPSPTRRKAWLVGSTVVIVAILLQWTWATYQGQSIWWRAPLERNPAILIEHLFAFLPGGEAERPASNLATEFTGTFAQAVWAYPETFLGPASSLLPVLGLAGLLGALQIAGRHARTPFWGDRGAWIGRVVAFLFAVYVVGYGGDMLGFRLPLGLLLSLALLRIATTSRLERAAIQVDTQNAGAGAGGEPLIVTRRRELLDRAKALSSLEQQRREAFATYDADPAAFDATVKRLDAERARLQHGGPLPYPAAPNAASQTGSNTEPAPLRLPETVGPGELALATGPASQWWDRGLTATSLGARMAWLPILYFVYVLFIARAEDILANAIPFALVSLLTALGNEIAFWLVAAFVLGCLLPYLRGLNGLVKGMVLAGVYAGAHAGASLLGATGDTLWQVRSVQLLLYLMLLGAWLDATTVERAGLSWRYLLGRYRLEDARAALVYAGTIIGTLIAIGRQFATGDAQAAITSIAAGQARWESILTALQPFLQQ